MSRKTHRTAVSINNEAVSVPDASEPAKAPDCAPCAELSEQLCGLTRRCRKPQMESTKRWLGGSRHESARISRDTARWCEMMIAPRRGIARRTAFAVPHTSRMRQQDHVGHAGDKPPAASFRLANCREKFVELQHIIRVASVLRKFLVNRDPVSIAHWYRSRCRSKTLPEQLDQA